MDPTIAVRAGTTVLLLGSLCPAALLAWWPRRRLRRNIRRNPPPAIRPPQAAQLFHRQTPRQVSIRPAVVAVSIRPMCHPRCPVWALRQLRHHNSTRSTPTRRRAASVHSCAASCVIQPRRLSRRATYPSPKPQRLRAIATVIALREVVAMSPRCYQFPHLRISITNHAGIQVCCAKKT